MVGCSIRNCKSRSVTGGTIKFLTFPRNESVASEWLRHCGPKTIPKKGRVCSKHFLPSDYIKPILNLPITLRKGRQLKPHAVPSLHLDSTDKQNTLTVMVEVKNEIVNTTENLNYLPQCNTLPVIEVPIEVPESFKVIENSDKTITITRAEHQALIRNKNEFQVLKKNLEKIFTPGQIRCLMNPIKRRIKWSAEDIAAAISLKSISGKCYRHLKLKVGMPLPSLSTLRKWTSKSGIQEVLAKCDIQSQDNELEKPCNGSIQYEIQSQENEVEKPYNESVQCEIQSQ